MSTEERLRAAAAAGEIVTIVYHGGSQPGTKRQVKPITVTPIELRAREVLTDEVKNFRLVKLEVVADDHAAKEYVPGSVALPASANLVEALRGHVPALEGLGWHVDLHESRASVSGYFKSGKRKKGAAASILRTDSPTRPWYVSGPDFASARTFSHLDKAVAVFLEQCYAHAPQRQAASAESA